MGASLTKQSMHCEPNDTIALQYKEQLDTVINHIESLDAYPWPSNTPHGRGKVAHHRGCTSFRQCFDDPTPIRKEFIDYPLLHFSGKIIDGINKDSFKSFFEGMIPLIEDISCYKSTNTIPIYFSHANNDGIVDNIGCLVFHWYLEITNHLVAQVHGFTFCKFSSLQELCDVLEWIEHTHAPLLLPSPLSEMPDDLGCYNHLLSNILAQYCDHS